VLEPDVLDPLSELELSDDELLPLVDWASCALGKRTIVR